jgi:hypothetical protein
MALPPTGQWGPIVGTVLAFIGALYLLLSAMGPIEDEASSDTSSARIPRPVPNASLNTNGRPSREEGANNEMSSPLYYPSGVTRHGNENRLRISRAINAVSRYVGAGEPEAFDDSEFKRGPAMDFPEIPGEVIRNPSLLPLISANYRSRRSALEVPPPIHRQQTANVTLVRDIIPGTNIEDSSQVLRPASSATGDRGPPLTDVLPSPRLSTSSSIREPGRLAGLDNSVELEDFQQASNAIVPSNDQHR